MTFIDVLIIGLGGLLVASALDNTPIVQTFQKIIKGQAINIKQDTAPSPTNSTTSQTSTSQPTYNVVTL